ncbi:hypothetical protein ACFE04_005976 [Oxalis oulophora]
MLSRSKEEDSPSKRNKIDNKTNPKAPSSSSASSWLRLKDPRIVRVSRAFGGKDRHSKVTTIRGLRDRRVRLSVPTAIQLYDLQDRLGLNQPSKVIDWLLNIAKDEIDELPPLPVSPMSLALNHGGNIHCSTNFWGSNTLQNARSEEESRNDDQKEKCTRITQRDVDDKQKCNEGDHNSSLPGFLNNMPYGSYNYHLEPSHFPLSHFGVASHQIEDTVNVAQLPSTLSLSFGSQVLVCPPATTTQPLFPNSHVENDHHQRQIEHFQVLSSSSSRNLFSNDHHYYSISQPFQLGMSPRVLHSHNNLVQSDHNKQLQDFASK